MRKTSIELLRIISMLMIVCLHYLSKGGALIQQEGSFDINGYIAWITEALCLVAVNVYVLISGYFATGKSATVQKVIKIWEQVFFYNFIIGLIAMCIGAQSLDLYALFDLIFPVVTEQYWFATAFILLGLLAPFLQNGVENIDQKSFGKILLGLLLFDSLAKSVLPMKLPWDKQGYDLIWFLCVYLSGMYVKRYGIPKLLQKRSRALLLYFVSEVLIFMSMLLIRSIYEKTGKFEDFITYGYSYNYLFCYFGAVGLFLFFLQKEQKQSKTTPVIHKIAGATFGVYLIHEHKNIRYAWVKWVGCEKAFLQSPFIFLLHMLASVVGVFLLCTLIELFRQKLFSMMKIKKTFK